MLYHLALILIGPILFLQGKYVKRVTPKLPEPDGHRHGEVGQGKGLSLLIVGDSAAAGVGVDHQQQALSGRLVAPLSKTNAVRWKLIAQSGDTSRQLLDRLHAMPQEEFDTAVVSIGVNDVTGLNRASTWTENVRLIVQLLTEKFGVRRVYLSSIPPMHLFPALPNPLRWWLGLRAKQFNVLMKSVADREASCTYAPIPYSPELSGIAADGFHPGAEAYRVWGDYVAELIQGGVAE
ncbi:SGNH/GDSL hydrolase family protein [Zhongshania sp.]|uniref:SGNH/GDSL hydrolase family protein n=2 Tax=Zhongshania sp. TaxID=1971902 RepID=UPI00356A77D1